MLYMVNTDSIKQKVCVVKLYIYLYLSTSRNS